MSHLAPCPACNRHVDLDEHACPFCAAALPASFRARQPPAPPRGRLSRAAIMAAGATLMGAAACSGNDAIGGTKDAATDRPGVAFDARGPVPVPAYGISLPPGTGGTGGNLGTGGALSAGGTGGVDDAGSGGANDAAPPRDASEERTIIAIYGAPFAGDKQPNS